ncbi:MAG: ribonuclease Z [Clostridiales bacterium]|nr:ribonuclease Z [Clostridiales bacterium]
MLECCTLGTGGALPLPDRALSSLYVRVNGRALLIDCGEGTQVGIRKLGWGFRCIDGLLITHFHGDHCSGLPGLLLSLDKAERKETFHIWGPPGLRRVVDGLRVIAPALSFPVELHELRSEGEEFSLIGLSITAFPLNHGIPCYGYRLHLPRQGAFQPDRARALGVPMAQWKDLQHGISVGNVQPQDVLGAPRQGISLLYATDTRPVPEIIQQGQSVDLMFLEGMYGSEEKRPQALKNKHMLFAEAADLARQARPGRLVLTHFSNCINDPAEYLPNAQAIFPETYAANDGECFTLHYPQAK